MNPLAVDGLLFDFPEDWQASKYDDWSFYRNQFVKQLDGIKAVDLLAVSPENTAFLIEVKDYRHPETVKPSDLPLAVTYKVLYALAALFPASLRANEPTERELAASILRCKALQVVLHIEQPKRHQPVVDKADIQQKRRQKLRAIAPHLKVVSMETMGNLTWHVRDC